MLYYLIIALQIYCAYHAYSTRNQTYWYLVIFFAPGIGSLIYLITQVFTKRDVNKIQNQITSVINPTKKISDLQKQVDFSDTFKNRVDLADEFANIGDHNNAIENYLKALTGSHSNDYHVNSQILKCYYEIGDYQKALEAGNKIKDNPNFEKSKSQFIYGLNLSELDKIEEAEIVLKKIDQRYSNYPERLLLAQFFIKNAKQKEAKEVLEELLQEQEHMTKLNRRLYRQTFKNIELTYKSL